MNLLNIDEITNIEVIDKIYKKYKEYFNTNAIIAYSGGKDSTVLLYIYIYLYKKKGIPEPIVFHLNHAIRDNLEQEQEIIDFLKLLSLNYICLTKKIKSISKKIKKSLEDTGRLVRYHSMQKIALQKSATIVTGHHSQDYLESILINFIRGGGESALGTIPIFDNNIFRPLLFFSESERDNLLAISGFPVFEDESNYSKDFLRNRLRIDIIGRLKNEGLDTQKLYFNFHDLTKQKNSKYKKNYYYISKNGLEDFPISYLKKLLDIYLRQLNCHPIKKKILFEIYTQIENSKKVLQENSEVIFWKSKSSNLYIIKKNSDCLQPPKEKEGIIYWNRNIYQLKENESITNYKNGMKINKNNQSHKISEILRAEEIPEPIRKFFPITLNNDKPYCVLLNLWDNEKKIMLVSLYE